MLSICRHSGESVIRTTATTDGKSGNLEKNCALCPTDHADLGSTAFHGVAANRADEIIKGFYVTLAEGIKRLLIETGVNLFNFVGKFE